MPFVSKQQLKACYAQRRRAIREGKPVIWDCDEWAIGTDYKSLPKYRRGGRKIYQGPKGGLYYLSDTGKKVYIKK